MKKIQWNHKKSFYHDLKIKDFNISEVLKKFPDSAVFETSYGFSKYDGNENKIMTELLLDIQYINGSWVIKAKELPEYFVNFITNIFRRKNLSLTEKLRKFYQILALPKDYPLVLLLGYSAVSFYEDVVTKRCDNGVPEILIRLYGNVLSYETNKSNSVMLDSLCINPNEISENQDLLKVLSSKFAKNPVYHKTQILKHVTQPQKFIRNVERVKEYLSKGDVYQLVLSRKSIIESDVSPIDIYQNLKKVNPAPYSFYIDIGTVKIISSTPELMFKSINNKILVRPIAGTIKKQKKFEKLDNVPKEQSEHIMLVDLSRNDLAKHAANNEVYVTSLMNQEDYGSLYHLVSSIETQAKDCDIWDILEDNFPAGTMVGAPKIRAMEIIDELEEGDRGIFSGCAGYITDSYSGIMSLIIRTIIYKKGKFELQAGAGIVYDSLPIKEWEEAEHKLNSFKRAFNIGGNIIENHVN